MKRFLPSLTSLCILAILVGGQVISQAQAFGPVVDILGKPDSRTNPPNVHAYVSVVDPATGRVIDGLSDANFAVQVSEQDVGATTSLDTTGVALVMVIDRGGIARRGDPRIGDAVELADSLLSMLNVDGSSTADMVALIGIRGREEGGLTPVVPFTDYDPNVVRNEFDRLRTEAVPEVTPLYDGIDQAIEWITSNPDADIQDKLEHHRPIIVVFSDGIDNKFSDKSHEATITSECRENNILLYAVRMEAPGRTTDVDNLETLASQTSGIYATHDSGDPATHDQVLGLFQDIVTQRQSYRVTFPLLRPQGDYEARIRVLDTSVGDGSAVTMVSSRLQLPEVALTSPPDGAVYTVPYSYTPRVEIPLSVALAFPDGIARDPTAVRYYCNGVLVAASTTPPFAASWDATDRVTQTEEMRGTQQPEVRDFTFIAEAEDAYLSETTKRAEVSVQVEWQPLPPPTVEQRAEDWFVTYWWLLLVLAMLGVGLLILLILLVRTRGELARRVVTRTTGVLKGITKRLGALPTRAPGKLVVLQGANVGKEFRLAAQVAKVGRDPQFCDFALYDDYVSNPHFSIQLEQTQFFITDEGSTNGTRVNSMPIPPHQRMLLQPDAIVEVGQTRLQFKRLGGTTRQLGQLGTQAPPQHPPTQQQPPGTVGWSPAGQQPQAGPGRGGPTKPAHDD
jgi:Mg-chelatase subunit ChlD